ncbi:hypothetical protein D3C75_952010 [compost metagenome]
MLECSMHFFINNFISFSKISTTLRMSNNDIIYAKLFQHSTTNFTSECTFIFEMQVLGADFDRRAFSGFY